MTFEQSIGLLIVGVAGGVLNTLAGGGSNLTLPALMAMGLPADIANATNRLGIFLQSSVAVRQFRRRGALPQQDLVGLLVPTLLGGLAGALLAASAPVWLLKPALLGTMLLVATLVLFYPAALPAEGESPKRVANYRPGALAVFAAGFYGGFVQAGVGFVLLLALASVLRYDLLKANALKLFCSLGFTAVALAVFIYQDLVDWQFGLVLGLGFVIGAWLGVRWALEVSQQTLKRALFILTLIACVAAYTLP